MMIHSIQDTIVALSTAAGSGAIAVIRISGAQAIPFIDLIFKGKKLATAKSHTLHFGSIFNGNQKIDEVVVGLFRNPTSYTGEDIVEISCHGSPFIQQQIIQLIVANGARLAQPGEFTMRAFLHGKMDLSQAEAVADLIAAESKSAHLIALNQMRGGFSSELKELRNQLIYFASLIELELDFSEEDVEFADRKHLIELIEKINTIITQLIESFKFGNVIKNGITAVIAGRPNAGKSTLLNTLLNEERALVSEMPGTTRDTIEEELNINGIIFRLIDTAGIREANDEIEKMGVVRTMEKIKTSAMLLYVFDVNSMTEQMVESDLESIGQTVETMVLIANKIDIENSSNRPKTFSNIKPDVFISSLQKMNIETLKNTMYHKIMGNSIVLSGTVITNIRHLTALEKTKQHLLEVAEGIEQHLGGEITAHQIKHALHFLGEITGEISNEDLLDSIFRNFCIGK